MAISILGQKLRFDHRIKEINVFTLFAWHTWHTSFVGQIGHINKPSRSCNGEITHVVVHVLLNFISIFLSRFLVLKQFCINTRSEFETDSIWEYRSFYPFVPVFHCGTRETGSEMRQVSTLPHDSPLRVGTPPLPSELGEQPRCSL